MPLSPGVRLGPYEILAAIGAGGMGEVYRARDNRLERDVAVKILPPHAADDPEFRARFDREAKTISQLNHPNICAIFDIGRASPTGASAPSASSEVDFIVMELLEGETLAARLQKGALPTDDVLRIAGEIADALDKAHRKGIVHRDLKPANVMLTTTGSKLLDFGLAKPGIVSTSTVETRLAPSSDRSLQNPRISGPLSPKPSLDAPLTARGTILGTFQYMAPEQIEGEPTDGRTDIWAFGCVLYEMITGRKAFEAKSQASLIASILERQPPPVAELQPMTPPALGRIVRTCLSKDPDDRFQTAHDLALQLDWIEEGGSALGLPAPVIASRKRRSRLIGAAAAIALATVAALAAWMLKPSAITTTPIVTRFTDVLPEDHAFSRAGRRVVALSPDGSKFVYVANNQLYLRRMGDSAPAPIQGTNVSPAEPVFSPDGEWIVYWSNGLATAGDVGKLWRVSASGGTPTPLCDAENPLGSTWTGSRIFFGQGKGIMAVAETGGTPELILAADTTTGVRVGQPQLIADGRFLLFASQPKGGTIQVEIKELPSGERRVLVASGTTPRLLPSGHLLFYRDSTIFAQVFDSNTGTVSGSPVSVVQQVRISAFSMGAQYAVSDSGTLAYLTGSAEAPLSLVWIDRAGKIEQIRAPARRYFEPRLSPDGIRIATSTRDEGADVFIWDTRRNIETRVTRTLERESSPIWMPPDFRDVLFGAAYETDTFDPTLRRADLTNDAVRLATTKGSETPSAVTPDGKIVLFNLFGATTGYVGKTSLDKPGEPEPLFGTAEAYRNAALSPDGKWLAYEGREGESFEVFVRPFPNVSDSRVQLSQGGGIWPAWSDDGRELFYVSTASNVAERFLVAVPVKKAVGAAFDWGEPTQLFNVAPYIRSTARGYDPAPGARRFVVVADPESNVTGTRSTINVVANWSEELKSRVK